MLNLDNVDTKAKIGQILILIAIILKLIGIVMMSSMAGSIGNLIPMASVIPFGFQAIVAIMAIVSLIGIFVGYLALKAASEGDFHRAGIMGIVACILPPLDIIMLIGGVLCLISEEA